MPWDPERYHQFQRERFQPFEDLLGLVERREGMRVIDLGCGTGELTRRLADALPESEVLGIDTSPEMLERAEAQRRPGLHFEQGDLAQLDGSRQRWDLVFSHAAIQWVDDHRALIPRLFSLVAPGGQIAVQTPANDDHPSHVFMREVAGEEPFREALAGWSRRFPVLTIDEYAELLHRSGGQNLAVMGKIYPHVLEDADAIADWMSGTALVPYFERLPPDLKEPFMERYRTRLRARFPGSPVLFTFHRILFAASR